jgi:DNA-directed RNA polymerase subunit RPC12/RpoP
MSATTEQIPGNWKCVNCGAVCDTDPEVVPSPCDYCGSTDIVKLAADSGEFVNH